MENTTRKAKKINDGAKVYVVHAVSDLGKTNEYFVFADEEEATDTVSFIRGGDFGRYKDSDETAMIFDTFLDSANTFSELEDFYNFMVNHKLSIARCIFTFWY